MLEPIADTRSRGAGLRIVESTKGLIRLANGAGCEVRLEDRDGDGTLETRRTRREGRLTSRCAATDSPYSRTTRDAGPDAPPALADCRFETTRDRRVTCQPTRFAKAEGQPWNVAWGIEPSSLGWQNGLLVFDDTSGRLYRLSVADTEPEPEPTRTAYDPRPKDPVLPRRSALPDAEERFSPEMQAIRDKQRETYPRAFDTDAETPQSARAFTGPAARAARRNRERQSRSSASE